MDENTNIQSQETNDATQPEKNVTETKAEVQTTTKSVEEQLQALMVENAKMKRAFDKASSEAADYKKKYNATLSEKEQADMAKAEEQARRDERLAELERENSIHKFTEQFFDLGYDKESAIAAATAQVDGDVETLFKLQKKIIDEKVLAKEQELIKDIPRAKSGTYASMTKEQIMAIQDREERRRAMSENMDLFE